MKVIIAFSLAILAVATTAQTVSSVHNDCGSTCTYNDNCCGSDSTCYGSITKRCCPNNSNFCGCLSQRGFCSGRVDGSSGSFNGSDTFGACFDPNQGTCTYDPSSNYWIVCRNPTTSCPSNSGFACCARGQACFTNSGASFATCAYPGGGPNVITPATGQRLYYNRQYTFRFFPKNAGDVSYNIITGGNNQAFGSGTLNADGSVSLNYTLRSFSPSNGNIQLAFVQNGSATIVGVTAVTDDSNSSDIDTDDCQPNGCAGGALCCGGQCYSTGQFKCYQKTSGGYQLCPRNSGLCGSACYDTASYSCTNGQLGPKSA